MVEIESPLGSAYRTGSFGDFGTGVGVTLSEVQPGSIVQVAAFDAALTLVGEAVGLALPLALSVKPGAGVITEDMRALGVGPGRWLIVAEAEGLADRLRKSLAVDAGSVTDLTHGRTVFRIEGPRSEWVLSKLFAIDFRSSAFGVSEGRATAHHDIHAHIQRVDNDSFELVVFRSFARAFWRILGHAAEEVGYNVR